MRLLIDSHVFLSLLGQASALPTEASRAIAEPQNTVLLSLASVWELQVKILLGRLDVDGFIPDIVQYEVRRGTLELLPIELRHVDALKLLPPSDQTHGDPFDRLLIAQTLAEQLTLVTGDRKIHQYDVPLLWKT